MNQEAEIKERKSLYIVWIIPFVAMAIAGWMTFKYYDSKGVDIVVTFSSGDGFMIDKTPLIYNGIKIGKINDIKINNLDITKVDVTLSVDKKAVGAWRQGNKFWKVEPKLSLTEVSGLSTIVSGVYISIMPAGKDLLTLQKLPEQKRFVALDSEPINIFEPGILVTLSSSKSNIKTGAPVLFRKIPVGKVLGSILTESGVEYTLNIYQKYKHLIKEDSRFWEISGLEIKASLSGVSIKMDSLASMVAGGITFDSPIKSQSIIKEKQNFKLFDNYDSVLLNKDILTLTSVSGYNLNEETSKVYFKGVEAGKIIGIDYNPNNQKTSFNIKLKSTFHHLANKDAYFWIVQPKVGLTDIKGLDAIAQGAYITFETTSKSKELKKDFILHSNTPPIKGKYFTLIGKKSYNLKAGVNIIYNDIVVGSVHSIKLAKNQKDILFDIILAHKYKHLINDSSHFYMQGAMEVDASLEGLYLNIGSVTSIINGGIVFETKDLNAKYSKKSFELLQSHKKYQEKEYLSTGGKTFFLTADTLGSIKKNSPIIFKGLKVGTVIDYVLNKVQDKVFIKVYINPKYTEHINKSTTFYNISGIQATLGVDGVKIDTQSIESIITGGIAFKTPLYAKGVSDLHEFKLFKNEDAVDGKYKQVTFSMNRGYDLKKGSKVVYKSITVGHVKSIDLLNDKVQAVVLIDKKYSNILSNDSLFWVENFDFKLTRIDNASALIGGAFITVLVGKSEIMSEHFKLLEDAPAESMNKDGLRVIVAGPRLSSLKKDTPVFYRQIQIGNVEQYWLSGDSKNVELILFIDKCYRYLVRKNSKFYNTSAFGVDISLFGVTISTETLSTMINGGIALVTPTQAKEEVADMESFILHPEPDEDWLEWEPELLHDTTCDKPILR